MEDSRFRLTLQPGASWSHILKRGTTLRLTDTQGGANVGALFYNFDIPVERLNIPDTLKAQHIGMLSKGFVLYSDMGRVLCSITDETLGWHDVLCGASSRESVELQYGNGTYQELRNGFYRNAQDGFLTELAKYGLGTRDLSANINFFSKVTVDSSGALSYVEGHSIPGSFVELRAEMNVLVVLNSCPHPLDTNPKFAPKPVDIAVAASPTVMADDHCRISRPENERGFVLTERYFM